MATKTKDRLEKLKEERDIRVRKNYAARKEAENKNAAVPKTSTTADTYSGMVINQNQNGNAALNNKTINTLENNKDSKVQPLSYAPLNDTQKKIKERSKNNNEIKQLEPDIIKISDKYGKIEGIGTDLENLNSEQGKILNRLSVLEKNKNKTPSPILNNAYNNTQNQYLANNAKIQTKKQEFLNLYNELVSAHPDHEEKIKRYNKLFVGGAYYNSRAEEAAEKFGVKLEDFGVEEMRAWAKAHNFEPVTNAGGTEYYVPKYQKDSYSPLKKTKLTTKEDEEDYEALQEYLNSKLEYQNSGLGNYLKYNTIAGMAGFNSSIAKTLALFTPEELFGDLGGVTARISEKAAAEAATWQNTADVAAKSNFFDKSNNWGRGFIQPTIQAIPNALLAMASGGGSLAANGIEVAATNSGILSAMQKSAENMVKNPMLWTSFFQTVGEEYEEAIKNGASKNQAVITAVTASLVNAGVEVGGGIETLPKGLKGATALKKILDWVKSSFEEGTEEVIQGFVSNAMQKFIYDKSKSDFSLTDDNAVVNPLRMAQEFWGGALVGGFMGGIEIGADTAVNSLYGGTQNLKKNVLMGNLIKSGGAEAIQKTIERGLAQPKDTQTYKLASDIQTKLENGADISSYELGKLHFAKENLNSNKVDGGPILIIAKDTPNSAFLNRLSERTGIKIKTADFYNKSTGEKIFQAEGSFDKKTNTLYFSKNATKGDIVKGVAMHELTHAIETSGFYNDYAEFAMNTKFANGAEFENAVKNKIHDYAKRGVALTETEARQELVAEFTREYTFADEKAINRLVNDNPNLAQRLFYAITETVEKLQYYFRGAEKEYAQLVKARDLFEKALDNRNGMDVSNGEYVNNVSYYFIGTTNDGRKIYKDNYEPNTPKSQKQQDVIYLVQNVWSKKPIELTLTNGEKITAQFDPTLEERSDLSKIAYGNKRGNRSERRITLSLAPDFYEIAQDANHAGGKDEFGKDLPTHKDVHRWEYFITNLVFKENDGTKIDCYMNIDVKRKSNGNYFYNFVIKKGTAPQTFNAVVSENESPTIPSGNNVSQNEPIVNNYSMQNGENNSQIPSGEKQASAMQWSFKDDNQFDTESEMPYNKNTNFESGVNNGENGYNFGRTAGLFENDRDKGRRNNSDNRNISSRISEMEGTGNDPISHGERFDGTGSGSAYMVQSTSGAESTKATGGKSSKGKRYEEAIARGDEETARKMLDEQAKENGYIPANVYHGTISDKIFTEFNGENKEINQGAADWVSTSFEYSKDFSMKKEWSPQQKQYLFTSPDSGIYELYIKKEKVLNLGNTSRKIYTIKELSKFADEIGFTTEELMQCWSPALREYESNAIWAITATPEFADIARTHGYDTLRAIESEDKIETFGILYPENIKSAKTVTYDEKGNIIPLEKRFDTNNNDIRYSFKSDATEPNIRESLPQKASEYLKKAERKLLGKIGDILSVPKHSQKTELSGIIQNISDEFLINGKFSDEAINNLFEQAYNAGIKIDEDFLHQYKDIKDYLRGQRITITDADKANMSDFNSFRKSAMGRLRLVNSGGMGIDQIYQELTELAPELFSPDIWNSYDQLERMLEVSRSIEATEKTLDEYYGDDAEEFKKYAKHDFEEAVRGMATELNVVYRYSREQVAKNELRKVDDIDTIKNAYRNRRRARKAKEKALSKHLLTKSDKMKVELLLEGSITPKHLNSGGDNVPGIMEVYEASKESYEYEKIIERFKKHTKQAKMDKFINILGDITDSKDKSYGLAYGTDTFKRNIRDVFNGKVADKLINEIWLKIKQGTYNSIKLKKRMSERVDALKISQKPTMGNKVSEDYAVQFIGEVEDNITVLQKLRPGVLRNGKDLAGWQEVLSKFKSENPNLNYKKINNAINEYRKIYNELWEMAEDVLIRNGRDPIEYRHGYFPHYQAGEDAGFLQAMGKKLGIVIENPTLPTSIIGLTGAFRPGAKISSFSHMLERTGYATEYGAAKGLDIYLDGISSVINQTVNIGNLRALSTTIRYLSSDEGIKKQIEAFYEDTSFNELDEDEQKERIDNLFENGKYSLGNFVVWLDEYTNILAGKRTKTDRFLDEHLPKWLTNVTRNLNGKVAQSYIWCNISSDLTNFIPFTQAFSELSVGSFNSGIRDTLKNIIRNDGFVDRSVFLTNRRGSDPLVKTWFEKTVDVGFLLMELIDNGVSEALVRGRYNENIKKGYSEEYAMTEADEWAADIMADRSEGTMPTVFANKNALIKPFTMFQLEVNNELQHLRKDFVQNLTKDIPTDQKIKRARVLTAAILKFLIGTYLFNDLFEKITGYRSAFDPVDIVNEAVGDFTGYQLPNTFDMISGAVKGEKPDFTTTKEKPLDAALNFAENAASELPFVGGLLGGGRIPVTSMVNNVKSVAEQIKNGTLDKNGLIDTAISAFPYGGNQIKKAVQGTRAVNEKGVYSSGGKLKYPVEDNTGNRLKGLLFGRNSFSSARDYWDKGRKALTQDETGDYKDFLEKGYSPNEAYEKIYNLKGLSNTEKSLYQLKKAMGEDADAYLDSALIKPETTQKYNVRDEIKKKYDVVGIGLWGEVYYDEDTISRGKSVSSNVENNKKYANTVKSSGVNAEIERLYNTVSEYGSTKDADRIKSMYEAIHGDRDITVTSININNETIEFDENSFNAYNGIRGKLSYEIVSSAVHSQNYSGLSEAQKASVISAAYDYASAKAKENISNGAYTVDGLNQKIDSAANAGIAPEEFLICYKKIDKLNKTNVSAAISSMTTWNTAQRLEVARIIMPSVKTW